MTAGHIASVDLDWRSATLVADMAVGDTVLGVDDTADFDEIEGDTPRLLSIAGDPPVAYTGVDDDTDTITLAAPVAAEYEAGVPVQVWDPTVSGGGAPAVEYVASVMTPRGEVPATIPHGLIPLAGVDLLIGAAVTLTETSPGEWVIDPPAAREAVIDPDNIADPYCFGTLTADTTIPTATWTTLTGWISFKRDFTTTFLTPGVFYVEKDGLYHVELGVRWRSNAVGRRAVKSIRHTILGDFDNFTDSRAAEATAAMSTLSTDTVPLHAGDQITFQAYQDSGAGLDTIGGETSFSITRVGAL